MVTISRLSEATSQAAEEISKLASELHGDTRVISEKDLADIVAQPDTYLVVVQDGKRVIGMGSFYLFRKIGSNPAQVEDVIVSGDYRGQGLGEKLMAEIIGMARSAGANSLNLTSRPSRVAANKLYQKLGFQIRETNVYKLKL